MTRASVAIAIGDTPRPRGWKESQDRENRGGHHRKFSACCHVFTPPDKEQANLRGKKINARLAHRVGAADIVTGIDQPVLSAANF
jgi:hypothetical protein